MTITLQTLMPTVVTSTSQNFVMDIDGDTINELIVFDCDLGQFSVVHQFKYSDYTLNGISPTHWPTSKPGTTSPLWPAATDLGWMTSWAASQGLIPSASTQVTAWTIQPGDVIMPADLDGDSNAEFFIYNLNSSTWGVLKWNTTAKELQTIYQIQIKPPTGPPPVIPNLVWQPSPADQYVIVPNMKAMVPTATGGAGILAFNAQTLAMGVISYQSSPAMFQQQWQLPGGTALSGWTLHSSDQFYAANVTALGTPSIVVHSPLNGYIDLLTWNGSALAGGQGQGTSVGGWHFYSGDQLQVADLDGDGYAEILIYNSDTQYLGVLAWDTATKKFYAPAVINGNIDGTGSNAWSISKQNQYFCINGANNNSGPILAFGPNSTPLAMLNYKNGKFTCQWSGASLAANNAWPVSSADFFYAADPSTTTTPTWFTLSNQGTAETPKMKLGALTWNGTTFQIASSATVPLHGWSPSFLASAPELGYPAFTAGNQGAIYTYVSGLFPLPTAPHSPPYPDIRKLYDHSGDSGKFETFAGKISGVQKVSEIPHNWPPLPSTTWSDADWSTVVKTISDECIAVDTVLNISNAIGKLTNDLNGIQNTDITTVTTNINKASSSSPSAVEYYLGQVAVMLLWGIGAAGGFLFPEAEEAASAARFAVFGSMTASAVGSLVGYNPTQQKSFAVDDIKVEIGQTYDQSVANQSSDLTKVLKDAIKLEIFSELSNDTWDIKTNLAAKVSKPFSAMDRLWMYQQLLPCYLQIRIVTPHAGIMPPPVVYTDPVTGNTYSIGTGGMNYFTSSSLSASLLGQDLFVTLKVVLADFCLGIGPWANIPRWQNGTLVPINH